jgi:capsular exopolysaccharide synthesis family protein
MSRVYHALEKAETRKGQKPEEDSILHIFGEKKSSSVEEPVPRSFEARIKKVESPSGDGSPLIVPPTYSYSAEQFRKVKTHILNQSPAPRSILITSTVPAEGKSMVAFNLALSFGQEKHIRTILVDADLRKPSIYPGLPSAGLSEYLAGQISWEDILIRFAAQNFFLVPAGTPSPKAPELTGSPRMKDLLKNLREWGEETYILIDAPPVLATSEPIIFSKLVDGIILVVMSDRAPKKSVRKAVDSMGREKIIGVVLNQINLKPSKNYSEYHYRYYQK